MYIPKNMSIADESAAYDFIDEFGFGIVVSDALTATHLPFIIDKKNGVLYSHFAKANSHWKEIEGQKVLVIFNGPHSYISPSWYASAPAVPTWNYAAVHAYGVVSLLDGGQTLEVVEQTMHKYEPDLDKQHIVTDEFRDRLMAAIVGFKIDLSSVEGKLKLGQHRSPEDQAGVYNGLSASESFDSQALAEYMKKLSVGMGD